MSMSVAAELHVVSPHLPSYRLFNLFQVMYNFYHRFVKAFADYEVSVAMSDTVRWPILVNLATRV